MSIVVDPRKQSWQKEDSGDTNKFEDGHLRILEAGPLMDDLDNAAGQEAKVSTRGSNLCPVGNKDGAGEVADHPAAQVDDPDPLGPGHLLQVPHQPVLESDRNQQMEDPSMKEQWGPYPVELVRNVSMTKW